MNNNKVSQYYCQVYNQVICTIGCPTKHTCIKQTQSVTVHDGQFIIIYYVSKHQLPYAVNAPHTTSVTRVNRNLMLLKLIGETFHVLSGFRRYPDPQPNHLGLNKVLPLGSQ